MIEQLQALYESAIDPAQSYAGIDAALAGMGLAELRRGELFDVAARFGICRTLRSKREALEVIRRKISERKASWERIQF